MEEWKDIKGISGYQVSTQGRIKKLPCGKGYNSKERIKKLQLNKDGYLMLNYKKGNTQHSKPVHRIVAETFIVNSHNKDTVNHKDGDKQNNCTSNLEWMTRSEQLVHAYKNNLRSPLYGSSNPLSKLSPDDVKFIREKYIPRSRRYGRPALAKLFNVSYQTIYNITNNITYQ